MTPLPRVTLIGAGPGDPDLLTIKAVRALRRATVALVDDLVDPGVLRYLRRSARVVHVGKRGGCAGTPQTFIHKLLVAEARRGEAVVRIKGGDPFVFGRGAEECDRLREFRDHRCLSDAGRVSPSARQRVANGARLCHKGRIRNPAITQSASELQASGFKLPS